VHFYVFLAHFVCDVHTGKGLSYNIIEAMRKEKVRETGKTKNGSIFSLADLD
jgi:hypothetical protein